MRAYHAEQVKDFGQHHFHSCSCLSLTAEDMAIEVTKDETQVAQVHYAQNKYPAAHRNEMFVHVIDFP